MNPTMNYAVGAEVDYRRERISHDLGQNRRHGRRHGRHHREALAVVAPYGDARA